MPTTTLLTSQCFKAAEKINRLPKATHVCAMTKLHGCQGPGAVGDPHEGCASRSGSQGSSHLLAPDTGHLPRVSPKLGWDVAQHGQWLGRAGLGTIGDWPCCSAAGGLAQGPSTWTGWERSPEGLCRDSSVWEHPQGPYSVGRHKWMDLWWDVFIKLNSSLSFLRKAEDLLFLQCWFLSNLVSLSLSKCGGSLSFSSISLQERKSFHLIAFLLCSNLIL